MESQNNSSIENGARRPRTQCVIGGINYAVQHLIGGSNFMSGLTPGKYGNKPRRFLPQDSNDLACLT